MQPLVGYADYPRAVVEDVVRLRRLLDYKNVPPRQTDYNLIVGTWNIRIFSGIYPSWEENPDSPKRNLRSLALIAEILRRFDVVAIQEVGRDTSGLRVLLDRFLGPNWGVMLSDTAIGSGGRTERLAYLYDRRRVIPSGLAGEIVLPPTPAGDPTTQFDRTPYIVGFRTDSQAFALLTAHIKYGDKPADRIEEIRALARYTAEEIRDRVTGEAAEEANLIVLGDFNIEKRIGDPLFDAFCETGLVVPEPLRILRTTFGAQAKYYDQIAWFMGKFDLLGGSRGGVIDFVGALYPELSTSQMSYRISDHFPLWVEFFTDRSVETMATTLGLDPGHPDPLGLGSA